MFCHIARYAVITAGPIPYHTGSIWDHTAACMRAVTGDALAVWMALCHDVGKCTTELQYLPRHLGHEARGMIGARELGLRLALPQSFIDAGSIAAKCHMKAGRYLELRPGTLRDLLIEIYTLDIWKSFWQVIDADRGQNISVFANADLAVLQSIKTEMYTPAHAREIQCRLISQAIEKRKDMQKKWK